MTLEEESVVGSKASLEPLGLHCSGTKGKGSIDESNGYGTGSTDVPLPSSILFCSTATYQCRNRITLVPKINAASRPRHSFVVCRVVSALALCWDCDETLCWYFFRSSFFSDVSADSGFFVKVKCCPSLEFE